MSPALMSRLALLLAVVFLFLAALHVFWALTRVPDGVRPTFDDEPLPQPAKWLTAGVAVPLGLAAIIVLARAGWIFGQLPAWLPRVGCWGLGLILVFRAIGEFRFVGLFKTIRDTRFAVWDTWLYSPLCLLLGLGALWLAVRAAGPAAEIGQVSAAWTLREDSTNTISSGSTER